MFKNAMMQTPLTTDAANEYFAHRIEGGSWARDNTFLSTLRALLDRRMEEGKTLTLTFNDSGYGVDALSDTKRALRNILDGWVEGADGIHIHNFRGISQDANKAWMETVENNFTSIFDGWHRVEKVTAFFRKVFSVLCFINPEQKSVMLFTDNMDVRRLHYLQCGIFAFLPWYFDPEAGVTDLEMELINSLREKKSDKYEECIAKIAEQYDFESARIRKLLRGFETRYEEIERDRVRSSIQDVMRELNRLDERYADYLRTKRDYEATLMGLEMKIAQGGEESEIMDYFLHNKQLILDSVSGSSMQFVVRTTLDYFDEELARRVIDNDSSMLYTNGWGDRYQNGQITTDEMRLLMTEVFLNQSLKMRFCAAYHFQIGGTVSARSGFSYGSMCR